MFKCECCRKQIPAGVSSQHFPIETREKVYPSRYGKKGNGAHMLIDAGATGHETVREIKICPGCYDWLEQGAVRRRSDQSHQAGVDVEDARLPA